MNICMRKMGMNQLKLENNRIVGVTFLWCDKLKVLGHKTVERDGYSAMILGFGNGSLKSWDKAQYPLFGFSKADLMSDNGKQKSKDECRNSEVGKSIEAPEKVYEYRTDKVLEVGSEIVPSESFLIGSYVDVAGTTKGRGFAGVMKRHNFDGLGASHGVSKAHRKPGSTGQRNRPGRVFKGKKMPGHYGDERITVQSLKVVFAEKMELDGKSGSVIGVHGAVPGPTNGLCFVQHAVKKGGSN